MAVQVFLGFYGCYNMVSTILQTQDQTVIAMLQNNRSKKNWKDEDILVEISNRVAI